MVADGPADLSHEWLAANDRVAAAEESARPLESEHCIRLEAALSTVQIRGLLAVVNDPLVIDEQVYELDATAGDLSDFSSETSGINSMNRPGFHADSFVCDDTSSDAAV